ncbi:uncharacterized protein LOC135482760 isoform X2 [Lineus longissimus]|uniref:uncharacterized protein LOC135482760 isoform X2 n=1 Tax=Lineus longissimus TaxID=88925 RepID=UPI00315D338F
MASPEKIDVASSGAKDGEAGEGPVAMDTDNTEVASPSKDKDETAAGKTKERDEAGDSAAGENPSSKAPSGSDEAATGVGDKEDAADEGKKPDIEVIQDRLPEVDIVMCFGRCQDCIRKACKKIRSENTKTDLLLCQECLDLHLQIAIDGEKKLNINVEENQKDSEEYPSEKRVPWECKNRPNYTPAQKAKYVKEKYGKRVAFDELDAPIDKLQTKFEYVEVRSDGLVGGQGTIELSIPDFKKPSAASTEGGDGNEMDATSGDKTSSASAGGDSGKLEASAEGGYSGKSETTAEGGDSGKLEATVDGGDSGKLEATAEGGYSGKSEVTVDGGDSGKSGATAEGGDSGKLEATAEGGYSGKSEVTVDGGDSGKSGATAEGGDSGKSEATAEGGDSGKSEVTVDGDDSGRSEATAEGGDSGKSEATAEGGDSGKSEATAEGGYSGKSEATAEGGDSGKLEATAEGGDSGKSGATAEGDSGKSEPTVDGGDSGKSEATVDGGDSGKSEATAEDGDSGKSEATAEGGDSGKSEATVNGGDSGKSEATAEGGDSGKSEATAEGGDSGKSGATAEGGDSGKSEATVNGGDSGKSEATAEGGDSGKSEATAEGGDSGKSEATAEGGDSGKSEATAEGGDSGKLEATAEGGDSGKSGATTDGGDSGKSEATVDGGDSGKSEATAKGGDSGKSEAPAEGGDSGKSEVTVDGDDSGKSGATTDGGDIGKSGATVDAGDIEMTDADIERVDAPKTKAAVEGGDIEMADTTVEGDEVNDDTSSTKVEKPKGSVTIEGIGLEKTTYDADVIRFIGLANNGMDFFVQMSIEVGEWNIKNYFFLLNNDTTLFQLVNNARRMMYIIRGEDKYSSDFLNFMEPINRLCQVQVTKIKNKQDEEDNDKNIYEGKTNILWTKNYHASLDPEYLWLKETLEKEDKALLLAYYNHDDKERDIIDVVKLRYKKIEKWITIHIFTTNGFEYKMEACKKNDKDYLLLKSKMTRSPIDQGVLKDIPRFVDKVKYLMEMMQPVTFGIRKERDENEKRIDHLGKIFRDAEQHVAPSQGVVQAGDTLGAVDTAYDPSLAPSDEEMKKNWEELCKVFKEKEKFVYDAFDATGLDPNVRDGFDQCVIEVQTNFEIGQYESVIDQAGSILEYYKNTTNGKIKQLVSRRHLMKFIHFLLVTLPNKPKMHKTINTKDVPGLAPKDEGFRNLWEKLREAFNGKTDFPTNALSGKVSDVAVDSDDSYNEYASEVQTCFFTEEFGKAIDIARAMLKEFYKTVNPSIKEKVMEKSLLKFIFITIFGVEALPGTADFRLPTEVDQRVVDTNDVPGLQPYSEDKKAAWTDFLGVFRDRTDFPTDALKETGLDPNNRRGFDDLVVMNIQLDFANEKYNDVIDTARAMMEIYQHSTDVILRVSASERSLLKFIHMLIFQWCTA